MKVHEIMTRDVVTVAAETTVSDALGLLDEQSIRHLPVVDDGRLVGLLSDRDLAGHIMQLRQAIAEPGEAQHRLDAPVSALMRSEVLSVAPTDPARHAIDAMLRFGVSAVAVVDGEQLRGIVSAVDILQAARDLV